MTSVYSSTPPKSAETRIREALHFQLGKIDAADGFLTTMAHLYKEFPETVSDYPSAVVLTGYEHREHYDNDTLYVMMKVPLVVFVDPDGDVPDQIESVKQDIHYILGSFPNLPGDDEANTCQLAIFASAEPFGTVLEDPLANGEKGVRILIDVTYQQQLTDPTVN